MTSLFTKASFCGLIIFSTLPLWAFKTTCSRIFQESVNFSEKHQLFSNLSIDRLHNKFKNQYVVISGMSVRNHWASQIRFEEGSLFRGMVLPDIQSLKKVLTEGLDPNKSSYVGPDDRKVIFFADYPSYALTYSFFPMDYAYEGKLGFRVLFEFEDIDGLFRYHSSYATYAAVPARKIKKIYILDKRMPIEFPFAKYSRESLLDQLLFNSSDSQN